MSNHNQNSLNLDELISRFSSRELTKEQCLVIDSARGMITSLVRYLGQRLPPSREFSLFMTHLEEASMWASKAIAHKGTLPRK